MTLRSFFRRRRGGGVDHRKIKMRVGIVGFNRDGFEHFFLRRFLPAFLAGGNAEIIVGSRAFWINCKRLGQFVQCLVRLTLPIVNETQSSMSKLVLRGDSYRLLQSEFSRL